MLRAKVRSFTKSQILAIPSIIPLFTQSLAMRGLRCFYLSMGVEMVPVVGTKRDIDKNL